MSLLRSRPRYIGCRSSITDVRDGDVMLFRFGAVDESFLAIRTGEKPLTPIAQANANRKWQPETMAQWEALQSLGVTMHFLQRFIDRESPSRKTTEIPCPAAASL